MFLVVDFLKDSIVKYFSQLIANELEAEVVK